MVALINTHIIKKKKKKNTPQDRSCYSPFHRLGNYCQWLKQPWALGLRGSGTSVMLSAPPPTCTGTLGCNLPWTRFRFLKRFCVVQSLGGLPSSVCVGLVSFQRVQNTHHAVKIFYCPDIHKHPAKIFQGLSSLPNPTHTLLFLLLLVRKLERINSAKFIYF